MRVHMPHVPGSEFSLRTPKRVPPELNMALGEAPARDVLATPERVLPDQIDLLRETARQASNTSGWP